MKNIVAIGLSTLKDIVLFPIGSLRNVFVESYILNLLLILCIYININDVFFFQILHMIMRPLIVTKKMAKESVTTMSPSTSAGTKLIGFSFENSKIREL